MGISLCSLCCGQIRQKEIHCPPNCPYLAKHASYQEKRIIERKTASPRLPSLKEENIFEDERLAWLALHIETPIKDYAEKSSSFSDKEALLALEYARDRIEKQKSLVVMPEERRIIRNDLGEAIYRMIENCRYEGRVIMAGIPQKYAQEEKLGVLDRIISTAKNFAHDDIEGRRYVQMVLERFSKIRDLSREKKIMTTS
jgi:hypothetical protein